MASKEKPLYTIDDEIADLQMKRPHVVILGAGASIAATPNGDAFGRRLPSMMNFVDVLGLQPILAEHGISFVAGTNFETLYAGLAEDPEKQAIARRLERAVSNYFGSLRLPPHATLYDRLVLSLRSKDLIATFNWDPFLYQACYRNKDVGDLPHVVYLHGGVATAYCIEHWKKGPPNARCSVCKKPLTPSKLLFPIEQKNYTEDVFISAEWRTLQNYLKNAFLITIFGYGAPSSDVEAVSLMKEAWGDTVSRELEQTEIIDLRDEDELSELWEEFIHTHHYDIHRSFDQSWLANHPRRTCETAWQQFMECQFLANHSLPAGNDLEALQTWVKPLVDAERKNGPQQS